jgi:hypothetical protein
MDPLTLALIARGAQTAAGLGKTAFGMSQQRRGQKALASAYEAPTGKPSEYAELLKQARASDIAQRRIDEINRSMASSTAALQQSGARGVIGGIGAVTEAGSRAKTGVLSAQQAEIMRALERGTIGGEYERQRQVARQTQERATAQRAIESGISNIAGGLGDTVGGLVGGAEAYGEMGLGATKAERSKVRAKRMSTATQEDIFKQATDIPEQPNFQGVTSDEFKKLIDGVSELSLEGMEELEEIYEKGGVQKTPGAFSHKTNPIDIMKQGAKIGEMTGGEYIFNPKQAKQMKKLASSGNTDLHKFVKSLLNKPQFK